MKFVNVNTVYTAEVKIDWEACLKEGGHTNEATMKRGTLEDGVYITKDWTTALELLKEEYYCFNGSNYVEFETSMMEKDHYYDKDLHILFLIMTQPTYAIEIEDSNND